jgi:hypothetical protein
MIVDSLELHNFKCFEATGRIELAQVNVFVGRNNSGKSAILRALRYLQDGFNPSPGDVRIGAQQLLIEAMVSGSGLAGFLGVEAVHARTKISYNTGGTMGIESIRDSGGSVGHGRFAAVEPINMLYTYLSQRKVGGFQEVVNAQTRRRQAAVATRSA